jgi:FixJ family two-component response regulator
VAKIEIAIVDDDESVREAMSGLMRSLGYLVSVFSSGESFLRSDRLRGIACLIADVRMPGMTGLELHRGLVASGSSVPTILITAYVDEKIRAQALSDGVACYLPKPIDESKLLTCIRSALGDTSLQPSGAPVS